MTQLLLAIAAVLLTALVCGALAQRVGQAKVIGEIVGGILLGPSVLGRMAPHVAARIFPESTLASFDSLSTLGLVLFLFLIGNELDIEHLRHGRITATLASSASIVLPFALAAVAAPFLYAHLAPPHTGHLVFTLFLGIAMSITAFPVLARILEERGLQSTRLGATALLCAAVDDVCAWSLLAVALTLLPKHSGQMPVWKEMLWLVGYVALMLGVVLPLGRWVTRRFRDARFRYEVFGIGIALVLLSAAATNAIGVHPLFGAFCAGLCFPRIPQWQSAIRTRLDTIVSVLLLPLFFALTGMRTRLDLLSGPGVLVALLVILAIAIGGKVGGAVLGARLTGQSWHDALALGALLNTRGLVELIVLNIAYNAHVFSPTLFSLMVMMALVTTAMTTPLLNRIFAVRAMAAAPALAA